MNKKILLISLLSLSFSSYAEEICEIDDSPFASMMKDIGIPNCITPENIESAVRRNDQSKICGTCREQFALKSNRSIPILDIKSRKELFIKSALEEYKKSLTDNLEETLKLRALRPTGSEFKKSVQSCNQKSVKEIIKGCSEEDKKLIESSGILSNLNNQIAGEIAQILNTDNAFSSQESLLQRGQRSCFVSEKDLLLISSRSAEEALSPALIEALVNMDTSNVTEIGLIFLNDAVMDEYEGDVSQLLQSLRSHPLLSKYMNDPQEFIGFLKAIPQPRNTENLRAAIYNKANGDEFDQKLAENCEKSFKTLNQTLCSGDFNQGKFNLNSFSNFDKLFGKPLPSNPVSLSDSDDLINQNMEVLKLCDSNAEKNKISLDSLNESLSSSLGHSYRTLALGEYKSAKYNIEIGNLNNLICSNASKPCNQDTFECKILQKYNDLKNSGSTEAKLATSSNKEVNALLRSMIGDTSSIDPKTKEILIANGIIPKDDGTIVEQPDIPERRPDFVENHQSSGGGNLAGQTVANTSQSVARNNSRNSSAFNSGNSQNYSNVNDTRAISNNLSQISDMLSDSNEELSDIQDEIRRRLMGDGSSPKAPTEPQVRAAVKESFKKRGKNLSSEQVDAVAKSLFPDARSHATYNPTVAQALAPNQANSSDEESLAQRQRGNKMNEALMGMAGAQGSANSGAQGGRTPASADAPAKDLTKVALNITEDPSIRLSDVFAQKLTLNDSETQLLKVLMKNQNTFLLKVKSVNFKIVFSPDKGFNLLMESGDPREAERLRPQLEIFLRRLR